MNYRIIFSLFLFSLICLAVPAYAQAVLVTNRLTWVVPPANATQGTATDSIIEMSINNGATWTQVAVVPMPTVTFDHKDQNSGVVFMYRFRTKNPYGVSNFSGAVQSVTLVSGTPTGATVTTTVQPTP